MPMDDRYTHDRADPLSAVRFHEATPRMGGVSPLRAYIQCGTLSTEVMRKARTIRACSPPPRLWHDLLAYHAIGVNVTNPVGNSTMDIFVKVRPFVS